jgi:thymidine kinase
MDKGYLKIIVGPMFSGKTTNLINTYNNIIKKDAIVINHISDDRYTKNNELVSHDGEKIPCYNFKNLREIYDIEHEITKWKYVLINESQFFDDLIQMVTIFVEKYKMHVYVSGLDGDFKKNKFGHITDLIPICDDIIKLKAKCKCGNHAPFSMRITNEGSQVLIGNDNYRSTCRNCHQF